MSGRVHAYAARVEWTGSTADGYEAYARGHTAACPPAHDALELSSLAAAARARIDVRGYRDEAGGTMDESQRPMRVGRIELRPRILVAPGPTEERVRELCQIAHRHCFVANSLSSDVVVEPDIEFADG